VTNAEKWSRIERIYGRSRRLFPRVPELTIEELDRLREVVDVVLVDVRKEPEQRISMIPTAVPVARFESSPEEYAGKTVVAYCTVGHRSGLYAKRLLAGGREAFNLKGAILAWTHAGRELEDGDGPTRRVHVAGPKWSLEADGYEPVW
jgi:sodium/bile acid cotransporter 7